ncbi:Diphthamide biosynthesis protein 2 [Madurella mycetomatis]|uniref:2-(3-amino-3-carboxypropyl)histidine synthase subunit 2 n=1 Tax=Madurella mycetomatis TaxID=100816 RepID=A0A175WHQ8_9PEZI|nr:Diphthamide biosynthesis protein 2 [Madurella mycetomatis]
MASELSAAPVLSTPAEHLFDYTVSETEAQAEHRSDNELRGIYEIDRTAREVRRGGWKRIALQFPDSMLRDAPQVAQALNEELETLLGWSDSSNPTTITANGNGSPQPAAVPERIYILADTSYSSCCVDEIAAEHVDADVVVHYGRSCLSPTSRLPVIYVFTRHNLDHEAAMRAFTNQYPNKEVNVILMTDVIYQDHVPTLAKELRAVGYTNLLSTAIIHDPTGKIPNRKLTSPQGTDLAAESSTLDLTTHSIFHISTPPTALLLALSSRVQSLHIHPASPSTSSTQQQPVTARLLGRRYARLLSLASAGIIGILVNTLSVSNYLASVDRIRKQIAAAGKKSYTVVVGKLNPAKLANFAEVDGWVVVGCWESSLVEDDAGFYKPVVTPFELGVALVGDEKRVWTGEWWGGIEGIEASSGRVGTGVENGNGDRDAKSEGEGEGEEEEDEEESAPPEFDLRTGRLISHSRPMRAGMKKADKQGGGEAAGGATGSSNSGSALALRPKTELATVNGVVSPGAEFLRSQRTWQGLGSDFVVEESTAIEEGRSGVARGYTVGDGGERR